jgi:hypothetical protein
MAIRYLTVQDVLWINLWATRTVNRYQYADLEEAVFYQYAYGDKDQVPAQADRLYKGFLAKAPFDKGNEATAFITFAAFLRLNGYRLGIDDGGAPSETEFRVEADGRHHESVRSAVREIVADYPLTLERLGSDPVEIVADGAIH